MSRYIDADLLIKYINRHKEDLKVDDDLINTIYGLAHDHIIEVVNIMPTADVKEVKLKPCPNCGCPNRLIKVHISSAKLPWWWYIECDNCHWCGKTRLFLRRAVKAWNKEKEE